MALFVPYLLHSLQQESWRMGLEADPCWQKGGGLWAKNGVPSHKIFPEGFGLFFLLSKHDRIKPIKPQSFQEYCLNGANFLKCPLMSENQEWSGGGTLSSRVAQR